MVWSALYVGIGCSVLAFLALLPLAETFGRDLDFLEGTGDPLL